MTSAERRQGFSRVDLAVVLLMEVVFLVLFVQAVYAAQVTASAKETQNKLKKMVVAIHTFYDAWKLLPPAFGKMKSRKGDAGRLNASLHVHILPVVEPVPDDRFLEKHPLYRKYALAEGKEVAPVVVPAYVTAADPSIDKKKRDGIQNFAGNLRIFADRGVVTPHDKDMPALEAMEPGHSRLIGTITDGLSNTILFATKYGYCGEGGGSHYASTPNSKTAAFFGQNAARNKANPSDPSATFQLAPGPEECLCTPLMAQSFTKTALHVGLADGSVRQVRPNVSPATWNAAVQPNDGNPLGDDW